MAESYDVVVVGGGLVGALAATTAAERGARVLLLERGAAVGATGPSSGVVRSGTGSEPAIGEALAERTVIDHRMLVLDQAASTSFDFHDPTLARGPTPAVSVRSAMAAPRWADAARARGARVVSGAAEVRLSKDASGKVAGVATSTETFAAPVTVLTEPIAPEAESASGAMGIEETFRLPTRSLENRFQLRPGEGTSIEAILGFLPPTWTGSGWILTHREHFTLGVTLYRPDGAEAATGLESAFDRFRSHAAIQGYTTGAERVDRRQYRVAPAPTRRRLGAPGLLRAGSAAGLGDPVGVFAPGLGAALASARAAGESTVPKGGIAAHPDRVGASYLSRLKETGVLACLDRARAHPVPLGWGGTERERYARVLTSTFHALLTETGAPKEPITRTLRRVRRASRLPYTTLASDGLGLGRSL